MSDTVTVTLLCEHLILKTADQVLTAKEFVCWACSQTACRTIKRQWVTFRGMQDGWYFHCTQCPYARSYGDARLRCMVAAEKHARKRQHRLIIGVDKCQQGVIDYTQHQPTLTGDQPPF